MDNLVRHLVAKRIPGLGITKVPKEHRTIAYILNKSITLPSNSHSLGRNMTDVSDTSVRLTTNLNVGIAHCVPVLGDLFQNYVERVPGVHLSQITFESCALIFKLRV